MIEQQTSMTVAVGDTHKQVLVENLTRTQIVQYAGASGDFNALHTDATYAAEIAGFPGVFAHGMLTMGMTGRILTDVFGPQNLRAFGGRFVTQVWPGDSLTVTATVTELLEEDGEQRAMVKVATARQDGAVVFVGSGIVGCQGMSGD
ncbi:MULTISPECIES: MaoC/PaaZ C-terminal domain-containing protein [Rhodococcus]|uniref:MaoC/PaaZ C-terminal domain-containing protein n=1 Tax=Rhodococcus baikonurensis TaxID=172041 RepID=A0ABV5XM98_9NOCA|nr:MULTISPECIES: MaoC/PaaZ C-terminal domain-containing protein [Rhodococcus]MCJ0949890.1 MaoC family dehydratase N-terminal domain-containing protein [Rhodococcus sp. ARC_M8]MCQ4152114.1 MaoC family dehydratase N-terminal domain-containing protein [Rhodococcus qingshengii]MDJ0441240.1 MaoC/PaaZ C-terminal domain-containing protein [Rhodococcus qingshengii]